MTSLKMPTSMVYQSKINWSDPRKGSDILSFTIDRFKAAVLDFQIQIEGELEDIIRLHFRDPDAFNIRRLNFSLRVPLVQALTGKTPDEEIWSIVWKLADFRNEFAHGTPPPETLQKYADEILEQLRKIHPSISLASVPDEEKHLSILTQAHFTVRRFFREIKEGLTKPH
jgi:hypothetical protein